MNDSISNLSSYQLLNEQIKKSWDENVLVRATDLEKATDTSYINLIKPWVVNSVLNKTRIDSNIMDIGCGCGYLTNTIYNSGRNNIIGIDISPVSIKYAQKKYPNMQFVCEDICTLNDKNKYDLCLCVMLLNNMADAQVFFKTIQRFLVVGGTLIIVIPHPCFWPQQHLKDNEYVYSKEISYKYLFATQGCTSYSSQVFYFHRMLETYFRYIKESGFEITNFEEITEPNVNRNPDILCMELTFLPDKNKHTKSK